MINRQIIRTKVVQLTYAYYQNGNENLDNAEKELEFSLSKAYHLYNYMLSLIVSISKEARRRTEVEAARAQRAGKAAPKTKFAYNRFALQLEENKQLSEFMATQKQTWDDSIEFVRKLLTQIEDSVIYKDYLEDETDDYDSDRELWRKIYRTLIQENEEIDPILEDKSLYWNDDKEIVDTFVIKTIKRFDPQNGADQELLPEFDDEEDREFALRLFRATIMNANQYQKYMSETSRNWDFSRLAYMDIVIMQIAIAEMLTFPAIPVKVTINEYVELAKLYSTSRSGGYINGMLDAIACHLADSNLMDKEVDRSRHIIRSTSSSHSTAAKDSHSAGKGSHSTGRGSHSTSKRINNKK